MFHLVVGLQAVLERGKSPGLPVHGGLVDPAEPAVPQRPADVVVAGQEPDRPLTGAARPAEDGCLLSDPVEHRIGVAEELGVISV